jgi:uncharacterized lipoprotein NlpE involved in copper resistance
MTRLGFALMLVASLGACAPHADRAATKAPDTHNSRNSLDWAGVYEGVLPCADCPGIKTRLVLERDGGFEITTAYIDRSPTPQTARGRFTWNNAGSGIALDAAGAGQQFQVGEGRLLQLNRDGSAPAWNAPNRVLNQLPKK